VTYPNLEFRIFGRRISIQCNDDLFRSLVLSNYHAFEEPLDSAEIAYTVGRHASGGFRISRGEETLAEVTSGEALQYTFTYVLEKLLTIELQKLRTDLYFVHSAALERGGRVTLIVAQSGTGKSTTSWALLQHGFRYLSDELAPIDPTSLDVYPYPHALCLKAAPPEPYRLPENVVRTENTIHIPVGDLPSAAVTQPCPLRALVFLQRNSDKPAPALAQVSPAEAGARLYANTLNALAHPGSGLDVAIRIAKAVPAFVVNAGDLQATCELISELEGKS